VAAPLEASSPWKAEVSGRLRSLVPDIGQIASDGEQRAERLRNNAKAKGKSIGQYGFVGVAYVSPREVRSWTVVDAETLYHPTDNDRAHSNIVIRDKPPQEVVEIASHLAELFHAVKRADLHKLPNVSP
jgi:hypothetical protein